MFHGTRYQVSLLWIALYLVSVGCTQSAKHDETVDRPPAPKRGVTTAAKPSPFHQVCHALEHIHIKREPSFSTRYERAKSWIRKNVDRRVAEQFRTLEPRNPIARFKKLRELAKQQGVAPCPLADFFERGLTGPMSPSDAQHVAMLVQGVANFDPRDLQRRPRLPGVDKAAKPIDEQWILTTLIGAGCAEIASCSRECFGALGVLRLLPPAKIVPLFAQHCRPFRQANPGQANRQQLEAWVRTRLKQAALQARVFLDAAQRVKLNEELAKAKLEP